jgi:hypothetical protein
MTPRRSTADARTGTSPVVEWRRGYLLTAGFSPDVAARIAVDCGIDLHAMLCLIDRGCPPHLAARILAPLDAGHRPC